MSSASSDRPLHGVNLFGYLRAESGVGEHARTLLAVLDEAGVATVPIDFGDTRSRRDHPLPPGASEEPHFDRHLICVNADQTPHFIERFGEARLGAAPRIGYWHWEVEEFPDGMAASAELVDGIWTASRHSAAAIRKKVSRPVFVFPPAVDAPAPAPLTDGLVPAGTHPLFLVCFDYDSVLERKNPLGAIAAFRRAFGAGTGAHLLVKSVNGWMHPEMHRQVVEAADGRADISIVDRFLSRPEQAGLIHACDVFVSLHRAEGFGLMLAEAMSAGKAVIATAYSGNLEFMNEETGVLLPWSYTTIKAGAGPYSGRWAEPDIDAAAEALQRLAANPSWGRGIGARARASIRAHHGVEARASVIRRRLAELASTLPAAGAATSRDSQSLAAARAIAGELGKERRRNRLRSQPPSGWIERLRTRWERRF